MWVVFDETLFGYSTKGNAVRALKGFGVEFIEERYPAEGRGRPRVVILLTEEMFKKFCTKSRKGIGARAAVERPTQLPEPRD